MNAMASLSPKSIETRWENLDTSETTTTVATYITSNAQDIHDGFGGSSRYNEELVQFEQPYLQLELALKVSIPTALDIPCQGDSWDKICEKINQTQKGYSVGTEGFWHKIWYKLGDSEESLDPWISLIPEAYGLAVVKCGLAVIFKLAGNSAKKRQKIIDTFEGLRDALIRTNPNRISFQGNQGVRDCCNKLYQTVVDAIEDMILATSKDQRNWRILIPKFNKRTKIPDPDDVLQNVTTSTVEFERSLNAARDQTIESTAIMTQYIGLRTTQIHRDSQKNGKTLDHVDSEVTATHGIVKEMSTGIEKLTLNSNIMAKEIDNSAAHSEREFAKVNSNQHHQQNILSIILEYQAETLRVAKREDQQLNNRNYLLESLIDEVKKKNAEIERLKRQQAHQNRLGRPRIPLIDLDALFQILARLDAFRAEPVDLRSIFQHPNKDFELALVQKGRYNQATQGQVQSLLAHERFREWMESRDHDLILVDANMRATQLKLATSAFCAEFVAGMIRIHPAEVVVHFFCSMHMSRGDSWYGPNGLIRSMTIQLLMRLKTMQEVDLTFVDNRDYLMAIEDHDLDSLCSTLWELVAQFPSNTTVYCVIDSISSFDIGSTFRDLKIVLEWLQNIVDDRSLAPTFKVLLTNPMQSTRRMKTELKMQQNQIHASRLINLTPHKTGPIGFSNRVIASYLLMPSGSPPRPLSRGEYQEYRDALDEGWNTD